MSSNVIVALILILNTIGAIAFLVWNILKKKVMIGICYFGVILFTPLIGLLFFGCAHLVMALAFKNRELTYADISFDATRKKKKQKSNYKEEIDILPLEEAFLVSETFDRRRALLTTIKKDYEKNISTILMGLSNDDSETSHYAASVVLTTNGEFLTSIILLEKAHRNSGGQLEPAKAYMERLREYIESNIPGATDKIKYLNSYTETFEFVRERYPEAILTEEFVFIIETYIDLGKLDMASDWTDRASRFFPENDKIYYCMLKNYYRIGDHDRFFETLRFLMSSEINISNELLQLIRFFTYQPQ